MQPKAEATGRHRILGYELRTGSISIRVRDKRTYWIVDIANSAHRSTRFAEKQRITPLCPKGPCIGIDRDDGGVVWQQEVK